MLRRLFCLSVMGVLLLVTGHTLTAEDAKPAAPMLSGWQRLFRKHAAEYEIIIKGEGKSDIELIPEPVLNWSQPVRGGADGAVFIWTEAGRPMVIGTLFIWPRENDLLGVAHELHSLSTLPLTATRADRTWTPPKDSIVWLPLTDAPTPAMTAEQRLRQMRALARQFQAQSYDKNDRQWELRLLPRAVYRYQLAELPPRIPRGEQLVDGAVFGFVEGTDLEIVMLIEAFQDAQGSRWRCAFARMSDFRLKASLGNKVLWEVDRTGYDELQNAYYSSTVENRKSPDE